MQKLHLIFVSSLVNEFGYDLPKVVESSAFNNDASGVNAMILCRNGSVMGILQGNCQSVRAAFGRMTRDRRHFDLTKLYEVESTSLDLEGTSAGLGSLELDYVRRHTAFTNMFRPSTQAIEKRIRPGICRNLLVQYVETNF